MKIDRKPSRKFFPKLASTTSSEELMEEVGALVVDMKSMLDNDLVKQPTTA